MVRAGSAGPQSLSAITGQSLRARSAPGADARVNRNAGAPDRIHFADAPEQVRSSVARRLGLDIGGLKPAAAKSKASSK